MAIYKPNIKWLEEQLHSLNEQDYDNLRLLAWDDCPDDEKYDEIFERQITQFDYQLIRGEKNLGSNGAFEKLTQLTDTKYIAYCDQDDIWLKNKISMLVKCIEAKCVDLVCSDMYVIDKDNNIIADSISKIRPRQIFYNDKDVFSYLLSKNFVTGCTVLMKSSLAKKALPFPKYTVHDWWLALWVSAYGKLEVINKPLMLYRIHGNNQTGILNKIETKEDYYIKYIYKYKNKIREIHERFYNSKVEASICKFEKWADLRVKNCQKTSICNIVELFAMRKCNNYITLFELLMKFLPRKLFNLLLKEIKSGNI